MLCYYQEFFLFFCIGQVTAKLFRCCTHESIITSDPLEGSEVSHPVLSAKSSSTSISKRFTRKRLNFTKYVKKLTKTETPRNAALQNTDVESQCSHPNEVDSAGPLDDISKNVLQWKEDPAIASFACQSHQICQELFQLELGVTSIVDSIVKGEVVTPSPVKLDQLFQIFQRDAGPTTPKVINQAQKFIKDVYSGVSSSDRNLMLKAYYENENEISEGYGTSPQWLTDADALLSYLSSLDSTANEYYAQQSMKLLSIDGNDRQVEGSELSAVK